MSKSRLDDYITKFARFGYLVPAHDPPPGIAVIWCRLTSSTDITFGAEIGCKSLWVMESFAGGLAISETAVPFL